jgi:hypothetical protein
MRNRSRRSVSQTGAAFDEQGAAEFVRPVAAGVEFGVASAQRPRIDKGPQQCVVPRARLVRTGQHSADDAQPVAGGDQRVQTRKNELCCSQRRRPRRRARCSDRECRQAPAAGAQTAPGVPLTRHRRVVERFDGPNGVTPAPPFHFRCHTGRKNGRSIQRPAPGPAAGPMTAKRRYLTENPSRWPFDGAMPKRAASRMRGAPHFAERRERWRAGYFATPDKIGSPAPRCAAPAGVLDPARSGMTGKT